MPVKLDQTEEVEEVIERAANRIKCKFHCTTCERHFSSLVAFDLHRTGKYIDGKVCREPTRINTESGEPRLEIATSDGHCDITTEAGVPQLLYPVTIWRQFGAAESARAAFGAFGPRLDRRPDCKGR